MERNRFDLGPPPARRVGAAGRTVRREGAAPPRRAQYSEELLGGSALAEERARAAEFWRHEVNSLPGAEQARGAAGVYGGEWDLVEVVLDNARLPRDQSQADGVLRFRLTTSQHDASGSAYVWRPLAAARACRIMQFSWPTLPATVPALRTNRAECSVLVRELSNRAPAGDVDVRHHFRARLNAWEPAALLYYQNVTPSDIQDAVTRSIGAQAEFYNDRIEMQPPVNLDQLTVEVRRGDRVVNFRPFLLSAVFDLSHGGTKIRMSRADGAAHELEAGQEVYFEQQPADSAGAAITEFAAGNAVAVETVVSSTVVEFATLIAPYATGATATAYNVAIPARRLQICLQFSVARLENAG